MVRLSPGFDDDCIAALVRGPDLRGLVLSLYGTGNGPSQKSKFQQTIADAVAMGAMETAAADLEHYTTMVAVPSR